MTYQVEVVRDVFPQPVHRGVAERRMPWLERFAAVHPCAEHKGVHVIDPHGVGPSGESLTDCPASAYFNVRYAASYQRFVDRVRKPHPKSGNIGSRARVRVTLPLTGGGLLANECVAIRSETGTSRPGRST